MSSTEIRKKSLRKAVVRFKCLFHSFLPHMEILSVKLIGEPEKSIKLISPSVSGNWLVLIRGRFCEKKKGTYLYSWCADPMLHLGKKWGCMKPLCSPCSHLPQGGQEEKLAGGREKSSCSNRRVNEELTLLFLDSLLVSDYWLSTCGYLVNSVVLIVSFCTLIFGISYTEQVCK